MPRFLHIADVHLDTTFLCRSEDLRHLLRSALRRAFERAIDCAIAERVDAVLVAGDLFDGERLSFATERFLVEQVARLGAEDIPFIYVTGNHDPGNRPRAAAVAWPDNARIVTGPDPVTIDIPGAGGDVAARIVCAGHATDREEANLARTFPKADGAVPHIGLLHTMVTSARDAESHDRYAPSAAEDLGRTGYAYWALGHIHIRQEVGAATHAVYSGNVQGRNPRETGPKGGLIVAVSEEGIVDTRFHAFAPVQWEHIVLTDLSAVTNLNILERTVANAFAEQVERPPGVEHWLVRVTLEGACPLARDLVGAEQIADLEEVLRGTLGASDVEVRTRNLTPPVSLSEYRGQPHLLGETLALLEELRGEPERLDRLELPEFAAEPRDRATYLRGLLEGLDREAAARLLERS